MRTYSKEYVRNGIATLTAHFEKADDLLKRAREYKATCKREVAEAKIANLRKEYAESYSAACQAMGAMWKSSFELIDKIEASHLTATGAEEDFKILALPVTLTQKELQIMAARNKGNTLFLRAVKEYAENHGYSTMVLHGLEVGSTPDISEIRHTLGSLKTQVEGYYLPCRSLDTYDPYKAVIFRKVEETGCFDKI